VSAFAGKPHLTLLGAETDADGIKWYRWRLDESSRPLWLPHGWFNTRVVVTPGCTVSMVAERFWRMPWQVPT
jgi:hypothetical protein